MNPELQTKSVAKIDGKIDHWNDCVRIANKQCRNKDASVLYEWAINLYGYNYINSRDAIIPVIEKVCKDNDSFFISFMRHLANVCCNTQWEQAVDFPVQFKLIFLATAVQLTEALLRATGKWKE